MSRPCPCGSGQPSEWRYDARGIELCRTCPKCHREKMRRYRPDVLTDLAPPDPIPEPVSLSGREARVVLKTIARMRGGIVGRLYARPGDADDGRSFAYAIINAGFPAIRDPTWIYERRSCRLMWGSPRDLVGDAAITWRGIDDPEGARRDSAD